MRRPSFQFYAMDWLTDTALNACSLEAQGFWLRLMCVMHNCVPYGHLADGSGKPMKDEAICRNLSGVSVRKLRRLLAELEENNVFSRTPEGVIFSRRMVRDEAERDKRAQGGTKGAAHGYKGAPHGAKGGRPRKPETPLPAQTRGVSKPPTSSSSSSSISPPTPSRAPQGAQPVADLLGNLKPTPAADPKLLQGLQARNAASGRH